jgi:hypothetical protein
MTTITLVNPYTFAAAPPLPPGATPTVEAVTTTALTASSNSSATFSGYTPLEDDLIILVSTSQSTIAAAADPSGWVNLLGSGGEAQVGASAMGGTFVYHWVTAGEESAVEQTYTCTGLFGGGSETGATEGFAIRGANLTTPIDLIATDTTTGATAVTPHVTAALAGASLSDDSLVIGGVAKDGSGSYGTQNPTGWTQLQSVDGAQGRWSGELNTATVAGVTVPAATLTPSGADEFLGWAIAIAAP